MSSARRAGTVLAVLVALVASTSTAAATTAATTSTTTSTTRKPPVTTTTTSGAEAARQANIDNQIRSLREQVEEASEEEAQVLDKVDEVASKRRSLEGQVRALDSDIGTVEADLSAAETLLTVLDADLLRAETKFSATTGDLDVARNELTERAVTAYVRQPAAQVANVLLKGVTFRQLAAARDFLRSLFDAQARSVDRYRSLQASIDGERRSIGELREQAAAQRDVVVSRRAELLGVRNQQDQLRARASSEESKQKALLSEVRSQVKEFEAQIASLKKESDAIAALLRARQRSQRILPTAKGVLAVPVPGSITSGFGSRVHPIFETVRMHTGVDFSASTGTPVKASEAGSVAVAAVRGGYGNAVILDHDNGLATLYGHLSRFAVDEGATVARGQVIGYSGSSGFSTGPHLHFEVRVNGNPVDPVRYL
ncbi:MAG TPA: peptidoglycan DD-metalloendopeptidase family protein [Acidimicrobiales bacterium]|nr:peptidoglycan DD-metalloendopeptidase family protein [Acidimicrobiales bacterium]